MLIVTYSYSQQHVDKNQASEESRHMISLRKSVLSTFLLSDDDSDYLSYKPNDIHIQYTYRLEKVRLSLEYNYITEGFKRSYKYVSLDSSNNETQDVAFVGSTYNNRVRLVFSYDILKKSHIVMRAHFYTPVYILGGYNLGLVTSPIVTGNNIENTPTSLDLMIGRQRMEVFHCILIA